jgi:hypothetical protein
MKQIAAAVCFFIEVMAGLRHKTNTVIQLLPHAFQLK